MSTFFAVLFRNACLIWTASHFLQAKKFEKSLEVELQSLKGRASELENDSMSKSIEAASALAEKDEALSSALAEIDHLKEEISVKLLVFT